MSRAFIWHFPLIMEYAPIGGGVVAYRIIYDAVENHSTGCYFVRRTVLTAVFFCIFLWSVQTFWPEGREMMENLGIQLSGKNIYRAAEVFSQELGSGYSFKNAWNNFCGMLTENGYSG